MKNITMKRVIEKDKFKKIYIKKTISYFNDLNTQAFLQNYLHLFRIKIQFCSNISMFHLKFY